MLFWVLCGVIAAGRLAVKYWTQPEKKRAVPWRSVTLTLADLWTCAMMGYVYVGGLWAAVAFAVLTFFEPPVGRALFMLFVIGQACAVDIHAVVVVTAAAIPNIALSLLQLPVFN